MTLPSLWTNLPHTIHHNQTETTGSILHTTATQPILLSVSASRPLENSKSRRYAIPRPRLLP